jgi:hypothetical protein
MAFSFISGTVSGLTGFLGVPGGGRDPNIAEIDVLQGRLAHATMLDDKIEALSQLTALVPQYQGVIGEALPNYMQWLADHKHDVDAQHNYMVLILALVVCAFGHETAFVSADSTS